MKCEFCETDILDETCGRTTVEMPGGVSWRCGREPKHAGECSDEKTHTMRKCRDALVVQLKEARARAWQRPSWLAAPDNSPPNQVWYGPSGEDECREGGDCTLVADLEIDAYGNVFVCEKCGRIDDVRQRPEEHE